MVEKRSTLLWLCSVTILLVTVNCEVSRNRSRYIPGVGKLSFVRKGAGVVLEREKGKLEIRVTKLQIDDLNVRSLNNINFEVLSEVNDTTYGIPANHMKVRGVAKNNASMEMSLNMFMENGTITGEDGNEYEVRKGSLKFNLKIDWPEDTNQIFTQIAFKCGKGKNTARKIKGRGKKSKSAKRDLDGFSPCSEARITFSPLFQAGSKWAEMEEEYPQIVNGPNGWAAVMLKFSGKSINYDPVAEVGTDVEDELNLLINEISSVGSLVEIPWIMVTFATVIGIFQSFQF